MSLITHPLPTNAFRRALLKKKLQVGLWHGLANANVIELLACTGYDWLLLDGEHAPNHLLTIMEQLRAMAAYPVSPIVRPAKADVTDIKQYLDLGVQTLLIPMIDSAEQARLMVQAMRYPPEGIRGVGAALARASRWNQIPNYVQQANQEMCCLVQAETQTALQNLDEIAAVEGVDGVFFGPADLSASMGYLGQASHPAVRQAICAGIKRVTQYGKVAGVLATDTAVAAEYIEAGASFVGVGVDTTLLVNAAKNLREQYPVTSENSLNAALVSSLVNLGGY